ncbi:hypothetical protein [Marinovum sp.]|uniref:hypothetical protein n=1 Tax=Marinovum sp. TaxID=2024839 RepID=UPI003A90A101
MTADSLQTSPLRRAKAALLSTLRPNQRRNWDKDQIHHYKLFLADFERIKHACGASVHGFKLHDLLEKEIRNAYWIYRSSASEQAVLIAKIIARSAIERLRPARGAAVEDSGPRIANPKALFVVSPATGVDALANVAASSFEKEEVVFVYSGGNSRVEEDIRRRGYALLMADAAASAKWQPGAAAAQFLRELRLGLRATRLNPFQKLFVYLYTRSALRKLETYRDFFSRQLRGDDRLVFTGRPRTAFVTAALLASHDQNARAVFVSHTIWYKLPCPIGRLYDLSCFSGAILMTEHCRREVARVNPQLDVAVVGMETPERQPVNGRAHAAAGHSRLRVGMFLGVNDFITEVIPDIAGLDVEIYLKTRPPGGNAKAFSHLSDHYSNLRICDHADVPMDRFCDRVDVIVGGYSTAVFHAASFGVPVIGYLTTVERQANDFLRPALIPYDLAVIKAADIGTVVAELTRLAAAREALPGLSKDQLEKVKANIPKVDFASVGKLTTRSEV